jgi:fido (protein-threonine AMPylation protein)
LVEFARQSNLIERAPLTGGWLEDHIAAAIAVEICSARDGFLFSARMLHATLFQRQWDCAGTYRHQRAYVGDGQRVVYSCPPPALVEPLMDAWDRAAREYTHGFTGPFLSVWGAHHAFESIHPFVDGNGRVGRLLLNNLQRILQGAWITVPEAGVEEYYAGIQLWRERPAGLKAFLAYADVSPWEGLELP